MATLKFLLFTVLALSCELAHSQNCWKYVAPPPLHCVGDGGCDTYVPLTYCTVGCISGTCNSMGNSSSCCGTIRYYAQIYTDGGTCSGFNCGYAPARRAAKRSRFDRVVSAKTATPVLHLPPRRLFVPNRCTYEYNVVYEWDFLPVDSKGM
jgi:hypothetical protein